MPLQFAQIIQTTKTDTYAIASYSGFTDIPGLQVTITPSANTSGVLIMGSVGGGTFGSTVGFTGQPVFFRLTRNGTPIFLGNASGSVTQASGAVAARLYNANMNWFCNYLDMPASSSAVTYSVQGYSPVSGFPGLINYRQLDQANSLYQRGSSSITVIEVPA